MPNLKIKIVESSGRRTGGDLCQRELNIILEQLLDQKAKVITYGKWSFKKSEILSMDVFETPDYKMPEYIEPQAHIGE
jgi:hypothetical protein